ncbi:HNH endonuclease [Bacillus cereus]|nr:HNH endonuclease [Bacillus cereus]
MGVLIVCKSCGIEKESKYKTTKFCSDKCRRKYNGKHRGHKQMCNQCSEVFYKYKKQDYCSPECFRNSLKENKKEVERKLYCKTCCHCNKEFTTTKSNKVYCSAECLYQSQLKKMEEERKRNIVYIQKRCKECGKHFNTTRSKTVYCSKGCSLKYNNRRKETTRRKRIIENGNVNWEISIERLLKRDGNACYLCGETVNVNIDTNDDYYPSIEHLIPIAKGGTHTWGNVKVAHRRCNSLKQDRGVEYTPR